MSRSKKKLALAMASVPAGALPSSGQTVPPATPEEQQKLLAVLKASLKSKMDACRQLGVIGTKDAVPVLAALLGDEKLSHMARYALEPIPDAAVDNVFRDALGKLKGRPLVGVIGSIGVRRDAKAVPALSRLLDDSDPDVIQTTARSLGRIATAGAANALKKRLATAPAALRPAVADGCLACAERLLAAPGKRSDAAAMYESVAKADVPEYVRLAGKRGAALAHERQAKL